MRRFLVCLLICLGCMDTAIAATVSNAPIFPQNPRTYRQRFVNTDVAGTYKTLVTGNTAGNNAGTRCNAIWVVSDDPTTSHLLTFRFTAAGLSYPGPTVTTNTTQVPMSVLNPTSWPGPPAESDGNVMLFLNPGDLLEVTFATPIPSPRIIGIHAECWDF